MLATRKLTRINKYRNCLCVLKNVVSTNRSFSSKKINSETPLGDMSTKYQVFKDQDANVILDVYEERLKYSNLLEEHEIEELDPFEGLNLERGITGVYDIEDLVEVLKRENSENIFVAKVSQDIKYVDYICVVSAKSYRHMKAIAQFVRRVYKNKRHKGDIMPRLEGVDSKHWMAIDLGNIALHIFSREARLIYDLDSLWSLGPKFDDECNKKDPVSDMLEKHSIYLIDLEPAH